RSGFFNRMLVDNGQNPPQGFDDVLGDLVLNRKHILQLAVVDIGPEVKSIADVDELGADTKAIAGFAHTTAQNSAHIELLTDSADVIVAAFEGEGGGAGGDAQAGDLGQGVDQLLGQAIAEIFVFGIGAEI